MAKKINMENTDTFDMSLPNSNDYPCHTPAISTTINVLATSTINALLLELVIQPSSLEVIQAAI
jgi:hypothetical protein